MRFTTRLFLVQLAVVVAVLVVCTAAFAVIAVGQVRAAAEQNALNIARSVAASPDVRSSVAAWSADPGTPDAAALADGALQRTALAVAERTDALFVVITDDHGIRLAHPRPERLGQTVSTPFARVLAGEEVVDWEVGTLGRSARAKVPVLPPEGGPAVGEVSVGFEEGSVLDDLPALLVAIGVAAFVALALGIGAGTVLRRRWEKATLGLQPEELTALVQQQSAVLDGVGDGVLALDENGVVRVCSDTAARLLGLSEPVGRPLGELGLPADVHAAITAGLPVLRAAVGDRIVAVDVHPVRRGGRALGDVVVVRDRTDVAELNEQLASVQTVTGALRMQRHEFSNRLHVAAGLIDAERVDDARAFLDELLQRGSIPSTVTDIERVDDPFLQALLVAKGTDAAARGVALRVGAETLLLGALVQVEDAAAVLTNLLDNAIAAAEHGGEPRWVETTLLSDGDALVVTVADSGPGVPPGRDVFAASAGPADDRVRGRGIGLPLSRELARRRGGSVWIIDPGGSATGAVFAARIPGVLRAPGAAGDRIDPPPRPEETDS
ncbi:sensor histidine kinase [Microbacterium imperiale]|uniref:Sensor-like histidine kinase SenX3 n=1 Tax=Microbacterium imperiale TaxID=33884 RepID=A0A9W6HGT8_9MICO|nr:sensor histidine kinase [Microbacterium imperiale]MBP2419172.1 two-component system CitB family sensor kinase [Microbacterium imperiale]MDS0198954.1 sensor histidine kinase [Microbacterium imperiale]BFE39514.1 sensor histidine kinase [Microbacterium imperiale]GLJ80152.1 histidine kinase [Microbacterium imperiale]